jgi:hypothetical protein
MRFALASALLVFAIACSDDSGPDPDAFRIDGTWSGLGEITPGDSTLITLELAQDEADVFGTLTTGTGRTADVEGTLTGSNFSATLFYTDTDCPGEAGTVTAQLQFGDQFLVGSLTPEACEAGGSITYELERQ